MAVAANSTVRVLVVDEEAAVRKYLQQELSAAGYEVDTLSSGNGFTEDMVALVRPDVLLVDPFMSDVPIAAVEALLARLRANQQLVLLLIDSGRDANRLAILGRNCSADGRIDRGELLRAPASAVGEQLLPEAAVEPIGSSLSSAQDAADTGEEIILELEPLPPPPRQVKSQPPVRRPPTSPNLLSLIEEELHDHPPAPPPPGPAVVQIEINLFSRHNFYVGSSGTLSTGGVFVVTGHLLAVGARVPLELRVPAGVVRTEAVVEWRRDTSQADRALRGVGLSLAQLPEVQRRELEAFFRERAPLTYLPHRR